MKCDNCSFEADEEKDPDQFEEIWCEDCKDIKMKPHWNAVVCTMCYNKNWDLEIWKIHAEDCHISIDIV